MTEPTKSSIYTRTGDDGRTSALDGARLPKDAARIEACGAIDELNSLLGLVRCEPLPDAVARLLERIQHDLFRAGAEISSGGSATGQPPPAIAAAQVEALEAGIDRFDAELAPLRQFILPAGTRGAALLHLARAVCRRAERRLVSLDRTSPPGVSPGLKAYLNRLGDLLFVLARAVNAAAGVHDVPWRKEPPA